ncbi:TIGR03619 family F420-dependent LLM class oxidoreductase [Dactylosporangium sucinum]|uniref:LLM class F420-dependent oxidoreductase n=1 Tax=Dactylosporangium sucinum TaxID=1424081 RepID=A0A917UB93_9ACTN|nr:TIGR03619 family F420-dependent LLM class oxidoreductase [Dactylosporangium sucinum]GGM75390.1 LLM class F420-dependent oxidoreductase [Dactylosporangium sucinum]
MGGPAEPEISVAVRNFAAESPGDWRHILDQARAADAAGIDRIFVVDHLVFGRDLSAYGQPAAGGVTGGMQPTGPDGDWLEPLTALAAMAAVTTRVKLATNVLVAPLRPAVLLAKTAATIDVLSHGRLELGVGVGWQEAEYRAVGVPFAERGRVLDETLAACRALWTTDEVSMSGRGFELDAVHMRPKPTGPGGVPVWLGGRAIPAVARRLATYGAGWIPWGVKTGDLAAALDAMRPLVERHGRDFATVRISAALPTVVADGTLDLRRVLADVPRLRALGVSDFRTLARLPRAEAAARDLLDELNGRFREAVAA